MQASRFYSCSFRLNGNFWNVPAGEVIQQFHQQDHHPASPREADQDAEETENQAGGQQEGRGDYRSGGDGGLERVHRDCGGEVEE